MTVLDASTEKITVELNSYEAFVIESLCSDSDLLVGDRLDCKKIMTEMNKIFQVYRLGNIAGIDAKLLKMIQQGLNIDDFDIHP